MKYAACFLALCAGTMAFAQTAPAPSNSLSAPDKLTMLPWPDTQQPRIFKLQPGQALLLPKDVVVAPKQLMQKDIDQSMILRPRPGSFIQQPPRIPLAHDLYPDLKLLPIETARLEPIPITWPDFKMEPIPITWPKMKAVPVESQMMKPKR